MFGRDHRSGIFQSIVVVFMEGRLRIYISQSSLSRMSCFSSHQCATEGGKMRVCHSLLSWHFFVAFARVWSLFGNHFVTFWLFFTHPCLPFGGLVMPYLFNPTARRRASGSGLATERATKATKAMTLSPPTAVSEELRCATQECW